MPSNLALAVGEDIDYVYVQHDGETFILAEALLEQVLGEGPREVTKRLKGKDLVGRRYERLLDYLDVSPSESCWQVLPANFVSTEDGTGIVHLSLIHI